MKRLLFLVALFMIANVSFAQSLSDDEVVKIIMSEQEKGTSQQNIATKLMKRGVTLEQLQRIKSNAQKDKTTLMPVEDEEEGVSDVESERSQEPPDKTVDISDLATKLLDSWKDLKVREHFCSF